MIRWFLILSLLQLVAFWKILGRMGFPPWLAIMASVPVVNLILLYYVALTPWPRETASLKAAGCRAGQATRISDNFAHPAHSERALERTTHGRPDFQRPRTQDGREGPLSGGNLFRP